jgi:hypothetical protein
LLTARHVCGDDGVVEVGSGRAPWWPAEVLWSDEGLDVAVLRLRPGHALGQVPVARWGAPASDAPRLKVEVFGFPKFRAEPGDPPVGFEHADGYVNPATTDSGGALHITVDSAVFPGRGNPWPGVSGGPVVCRGAVIGVVQQAGVDRLTALPVERLLLDRRCGPLLRAHLGGEPLLDPVDLSEITAMAPPALRSPMGLLHPSRAALPLVVRGDELVDLLGWAREPGFAACVLHGSSGSGKTRLAHELVRLFARLGDAAAFVAETDTSRLEVRDDLAHLERLRRPALLVVDYAETKPELITVLLEHLARNEWEHPVKLLLLARSAGAWWRLLRSSTAAVEEILDNAEDRRLADWVLSPTAAEKCFDRALTRLVELLPAVPRGRGVDWATAARKARDEGAALSARSPMSCQVAALTALLDAADLPAKAGDSTSELMSTHERRYWRRAAEQADVKVAEDSLTAYMALACLYGARDEDDAVALLKSYSRIDDVGWLNRMARFVHDRTSDDDAGRDYWEPLRPSALAEYLVRTEIHKDPDLLTTTLPRARGYQIVHALTTLGRAAPTDPKLWAEVTTTMATYRHIFDWELLVGVAVAVPDPSSLITVVQTVHGTPRRDQSEILAAVRGEATTDDALRRLWQLYLQAHSRLPVAGLRRAAARAAEIAKLLEEFQPALADAIAVGADTLPVVAARLGTLHDIVDRLSDLDTRDEQHHVHDVEAARKIAYQLLSFLDTVSAHAPAFSSSLAPLGQLTDALRDLADEVDASRRRLREVADRISRGRPGST